MTEVYTYPEMNKTIKGLLKSSDEPMLMYAAARIEELETAALQWIPVTERLPEENGRVLVVLKEDAEAEKLGFDLHDTTIKIMMYRTNTGFMLPFHSPGWINDVIKQEVTHWLPLPELPEGVDNG